MNRTKANRIKTELEEFLLPFLKHHKLTIGEIAGSYTETGLELKIRFLSQEEANLHNKTIADGLGLKLTVFKKWIDCGGHEVKLMTVSGRSAFVITKDGRRGKISKRAFTDAVIEQFPELDINKR